MLSSVAGPTTAVEACEPDGFRFENGLRITGGRGCMLVNGEAWEWCPWLLATTEAAGTQQKGGARPGLLNALGQWQCDERAWGALGMLWPRPDLLILGMGPSIHPLAPSTRRHLNALGLRIEVQDTRNAAAQFNLLATERGASVVAAALVPMGWREGGGGAA
ncbi:MAG: hypothetical protein M1826_004909 [Phylliscum demangeonii]|nr:MAG: hypothetical protein M1826_004909 [Phylliscum demangeonii]